MKKIFKNNDLFKIIGLVILFTTLLTWIISNGQFDGGANGFMLDAIRRIGIIDFFSAGISAVQWFFLQVTFLLILGGFYGILSKIKGYQNLVSKVAKSIKGKEIIFVLVTSFVFAFLTSISTNYFQVLVFVPLVISIMLKAKINKISAFSTTFGALLIGIIGSTFSGSLSDLNYYIGLSQDVLMWAKIVIFFAAYAAFNLFNLLHMVRLLKKNDDDVEDLFEEDDTKGKATTLPLVIIFSVLFVLVVIGYINWSATFGVEVFHNFHTWITELKVGGHQIFQYIIGNGDQYGVVPGEIGTWDLFIVQIIMLISCFVIRLIYKIKFDESLSAFGEGAKKMLKPLVIFILVNFAFAIVVTSQFIPTIVNFILNFSKSFNVYLMSLASLIIGFFDIDLGYCGYLFGSYFGSVYSVQKEVIMIVMNSMHGLIAFIAPTSVVLMIGLSYLNIEYKKWFKYIWKFLIVMLVILLILFTLLTYVF